MLYKKVNSNKMKIFVAGFFSNFFEYYDFMLWGAFSIILAKQFFSGEEDLIILKSLATFGVSFFARPFGSLFFGYLGDTRGRKKALHFSVFLMGISTFAIGCLPTYKQIGMSAPIILVILRLLQGFSLGGESSGSYIYVLEKINKKKGFIGALVLAGGTAGMFVANVQAQIFTQQNMFDWAWRIPFLMGILIAALGWYIRDLLNDSITLNKHSNNFSLEKQLRLIIKYISSFFRTIGIGFVSSTYVYMMFVYIPVYLNQEHSHLYSYGWFVSNLGLLICFFSVPIMGYLSERISYRRLMWFFFIASLIGSFLLPYCLYKNHFIIVTLYLAFLISTFNAPSPVFLSRLFPKNIRYTGVSVGFSLGVACGALSPFIFAYFTLYFNSIFSIIPILIFVSLIGFLSTSIPEKLTQKIEFSTGRKNG